MIGAAVLAVVFGILRGIPRSNPAESILAVIFAVGLFAVLLLVPYLRPDPVKAALDDPPEDPDELMASLEQGLAMNLPRPAFRTALARYRLMGLYKVRKRYEDAIEQGRSILRLMCASDSFESEIHLEIAICFDFLGRPDEAEAERLEAAECLKDGPEDYLGWLARGKLFDKVNRYHEAAEAYERALEWILPEDTNSRDNLLIQLVLATFNAGRSEETLKWAEQAIAVCTSERRLYAAHRMAGVAAANLGRLDEAEHHRQRAYNMAVEEGDAKKISDSLALLADLHRQRGDLDTAEALCLKAESLGPDSTRLVILTFVAVLRPGPDRRGPGGTGGGLPVWRDGQFLL